MIPAITRPRAGHVRHSRRGRTTAVQKQQLLLDITGAMMIWSNATTGWAVLVGAVCVHCADAIDEVVSTLSSLRAQHVSLASFFTYTIASLNVQSRQVFCLVEMGPPHRRGALRAIGMSSSFFQFCMGPASGFQHTCSRSCKHTRTMS